MKVIHNSLEILARILVLFAAVFACSTAVAAESNLPKALSGNIAGDDASTRFFINFDRELPVQTFYMDQPNRIIIDIGEAEFDDVEEDLAPRGLISNVRVGRIAKGRSRIVLTLVKPAEIIKASMAKRLDDDEFRFLMDIDSTDQATFAKLLEEQRKTIGESGLKAEKGDRVILPKKKEGKFLVVLDPGHGGIDGGAIGRNGTQEKEVVLAIAKILREKIEDAGPYQVKMTREEDEFLSLKERLEFGRRVNADLFISLHADSLTQRFVRGSTVYTLSKKASDRLSQDLAEAENSVDLVAGLAVEEEAEAITDILYDLTTRETKLFSKRFSGILVEQLSENIRLINNPQRSASFGVLKAPDVPSVLIELGYLSNAEDEKLLLSEEWRQKATDAITGSVLEFFAGRQP